eukprot:GHVH01006358.1.p2 GENE.GHVH01006358.1~~GHVH01006358.1.p2  ORF type:complete len:542 (-),score=83.50 GHVH01006358.1:2077-3702(-)
MITKATETPNHKKQLFWKLVGSEWISVSPDETLANTIVQKASMTRSALCCDLDLSLNDMAALSEFIADPSLLSGAEAHRLSSLGSTGAPQFDLSTFPYSLLEEDTKLDQFIRLFFLAWYHVGVSLNSYESATSSPTVMSRHAPRPVVPHRTSKWDNVQTEMASIPEVDYCSPDGSFSEDSTLLEVNGRPTAVAPPEAYLRHILPTPPTVGGHKESDNVSACEECGTPFFFLTWDGRRSVPMDPQPVNFPEFPVKTLGVHEDLDIDSDEEYYEGEDRGRLANISLDEEDEPSFVMTTYNKPSDTGSDVGSSSFDRNSSLHQLLDSSPSFRSVYSRQPSGADEGDCDKIELRPLESPSDIIIEDFNRLSSHWWSDGHEETLQRNDSAAKGARPRAMTSIKPKAKSNRIRRVKTTNLEFLKLKLQHQEAASGEAAAPVSPDGKSLPGEASHDSDAMLSGVLLESPHVGECLSLLTTIKRVLQADEVNRPEHRDSTAAVIRRSASSLRCSCVRHQADILNQEKGSEEGLTSGFEDSNSHTNPKPR